MFPSVLLAARESLMAGNWKMNPETVEEAVALAKKVQIELNIKSFIFRIFYDSD